ncbi:class I SAM-dependent methyltransferase [Thermomonas sp. HDW16]|uniref:class I SAM-dependent methyltransferase n=1 Tax=Thermomonas sp. HDW16 TaxID=2714945 RepID=UPI00140E484E|nr:class I SAM-dependent methyltransferase [Thermomonas sp. HDW16]QIL21424.1 class I SAM-dependent methyltransferase [Thermomonas sp. HDW16]
MTDSNMLAMAHRNMRPGRASLVGRVIRYALRSWFRLSTLGATAYRAPGETELAQIESGFRALDMPCEDLRLDVAEFSNFAIRFPFPSSYYDGLHGTLHVEKQLEHFVAWKLLGLEHADRGAYVDIAACASPWARLLRNAGVDAYAIDLEVDAAFESLHYYRQENATQSTFVAGSIFGASLQCAFEMFVGEDDHGLIIELARILAPGGRAVISPLYTHTHPCYYQTPEFYGAPVGDAGATAYVRRGAWGVQASRKYSPQTLRTRVWDVAMKHGLQPRLLVLRNKMDFGQDIYLHFVLVLEKPAGVFL